MFEEYVEMRDSQTSRAIWALAACMMIVAAACSSSAKPQTSPTTRARATSASVKASSLAKANAICRRMNTRIDALNATVADPNKRAAVADHAAVIVRSTLRDLQALPTPPSERAKVSAIVSQVAGVITDLSRLSTALRAHNNAATATAAATLESDVSNVESAASAYGATACATR